MKRGVALLSLFALSGCVHGNWLSQTAEFRQVRPFQQVAVFKQAARPIYGYVFQLTTRPLTENFDHTPVGDLSASGAGSVKQLQYRGARVLWDDDSIGSLAKEAGLEEVYYADIQTLSILNLYTQYKVRVYGRRAGAPEPPR